jgi:hypothetical protein
MADRMTWHSVERKRGFGIEVESDDGFWMVRQFPSGGSWTLFRKIDVEREWGEYRYSSLEVAMEIAQETVDEEAAAEVRRQAEGRTI